MKVSIGLELQCPYLTVSHILPNHVLRYSIQDFRTVLSSNAIVYNDVVSDRLIRYQLKNLQEEIKLKKWKCFFLQTPSAPFQIDEMIGLENDAEFIFTYPQPISTSNVVQNIIDYLKKALEYLCETHLPNPPLLIQKINVVRTNGREMNYTKPFPFKQIFLSKDRDDIAYLSKGDAIIIQEAPFYVQATIGCKWNQVISILNQLIDQYCAIVPPHHQIPRIHLFHEIQNEVKQSFPKLKPLLYTFIVLYLYTFVNMVKIKKAVFIIRHRFKHIVSLLTFDEFETVLINVQTLVTKNPDLFNGSYGMLLRLRNDEYESQEYAIIVTRYPFESFDSMVLFEFRVIHPILAHHLSLKWDDLISFSSFQNQRPKKKIKR